MAARALRALLTGLFLALASLQAFAFDNAELAPFQDKAAALKTRLEAIQVIINDPASADDQLSAQRDVIEKLRTEAVNEAQQLAAPLSDVQQQLAKLGPPPAEGQTEAATIAAVRANLNDQAANIAAAAKKFELLQLDADQTLVRLLAKQRALFLERIFKADRTVLNPQLWLDYGTGMRLMSMRLDAQWNSWLDSQSPTPQPRALLFIPVVLLIFFLFHLYVRPWAARRFGYSPVALQPGQTEPDLLRLWRAVWGVFFFTLAVFILFLLFFAAAGNAAEQDGLGRALIDSLAQALLPTAVYGCIAYYISQPRHPERRMIAVDTPSARLLTVLVVLVSAVLNLSTALIGLAEKIFLPVGFVIGQSAVAVLLSIILLSLILSVLRRQAEANEAGRQPYFLVWFLRLVPLLWALLAISLFSLFLGYIAFAYFIVGNLLDTAMLAVVLGVLHAFLQALAASAMQTDSRLGRMLRGAAHLTEEGVSRLVLIFRTVTDVLIVLIAIPSLIAMWTVTLVDLNTVISGTMRGFSIGNIVISPSVIVLALVVLAVGILLTRLFTNWLQNRVLHGTQLDKGVQDSLRTGAGYVGYTLAGALALSSAGLDFSSLALVAGALGVGIGLGLQSVTNNFVSGLILLAERPVRVGDWIVAQGNEGIVKKINVRATEIETFDHSSIVIPNSALITNAVRNWTLRDTLGRFSVAVSFVHGTDAKDVIAKLEQLATDHPKVMRHPPPKALLSRIGPQSLDFDLGGQVADVLEAAAVASDLRLAIVKSFDKKLLRCPDPPRAS